MGPNTLFDKSFLQSLSVDESVWFDHFFLANICPLFYVETLADLEKKLKGRTPEDEVAIIADKFPEMHGSPNANHIQMCVHNIMGHPIPMTGQIPLAGGQIVKDDGRTGVVFKQSPEAEAFNRWLKKDFLEIEQRYAKEWREALSYNNLDEIAKKLRTSGITCKSLGDAKAAAQKIINKSYVPAELMRWALQFLGIPWEKNEEIFAKWRSTGFVRSIEQFAPYAGHVLTVELFFHIALASGLISSERSSNRVDIAYLFYLPFCMVFVSSDRLHKRCAPLFLRRDQEFVWGPDLKQDLAKLNQYYAKMPDSEKERGILSFAGDPPKEGGFLTTQIWDRRFPNWRSKRRISSATSGSLDNSTLLEQMKKLVKAPAIRQADGDFDPQKIDMLSVKRLVRKKKGSWYQVPKDLEISNEDSQ
jgi:hypothetical protein